jgi:hypothetical protein
MSRLEKTIEELGKQVLPARLGMKATNEVLYSNEDTGTVVYHVLTSNSTLPYPVTEHITWGYFLVGNERGYAESDCYVASEASFRLGKISEDKKSVRIPREGYMTTYFEIQVPVQDLVFEKSKFKPYAERGL